MYKNKQKKPRAQLPAEIRQGSGFQLAHYEQHMSEGTYCNSKQKVVVR